MESAMKNILSHDLDAAIDDVRQFASANPYLMNMDELTAIEDDFRRMASYMRRGYADPERANLYDRLIQRLYEFAANMRLAYKKKNEPMFMSAASTANSFSPAANPCASPIGESMSETSNTAPYSHENIRHELENFVADVAMLQLMTDGEAFWTDDKETPSAGNNHFRTDEQAIPTGDNEKSQSAKRDNDTQEQANRRNSNAKKEETRIYGDHDKWMNSLFSKLFISEQWRTSDADFFENLLLSPTVETADAQLLTSAITLSCIAEFDVNKLATLLHVYLRSEIQPVKQRALVGFALSMSDIIDIYPTQKRDIARQCADTDVMNDLIDMQKQMIYCMNAESDKQDIQRNIIPTIVKNNNFSITRDGIIEKDESMDDILGTSDADKRMEEMEKSFRRMFNMQKQGSDIYFGGFSQMKRFPFFYTLKNWFTPFSIHHPALANIASRMSKADFLSNMLSQCPFCDSDKYSFAFAISTIIDNVPANIREMLESSNGIMPIDENIDYNAPAYIRRMYLQDLFRFFRLYPQPNRLRNPFRPDSFAFITSDVFCGNTQSENVASLCHLFYKNNFGEALQAMTKRFAASDDSNAMIYRAIYELRYGKGAKTALPLLETLHTASPDNDYVTSLLARAYMQTRQWRKAVRLYAMLHSAHPDDKGKAVNYCAALIKCSDFDNAAPLLFRLQFNYPDDINVIRLLAWTLMGQGKLEDADKQYANLLNHEKHIAGDCLNAAYCKWFIGDITAAVRLFRSFTIDEKTPITTLTKEQKDIAVKKLRKEFDNDEAMLKRHDITAADIFLMEYIVTHEE